MKMEPTEFENKQKIGQLSFQGQQYIEHGTPGNAIDCFVNAYQLSRQVGDDQLERTCALNLGAAYIESGQAAKGLKFLHKATPPSEEKDGTSNGDLYYNFALGHEAMKNFSESVKYYQLASREFRADTIMQIQCLTKCAQFYSSMKNFKKTIEIYEQMCNVYKTQDDSVMQASCLCDIAANQRFAQDDTAAGKAANDAYDVLVKLSEAGDVGASSNRDLAGKVFNDLGLVYTQLQNYDMACSCFEKALPLVRAPSENKQLEAVILQNLGAAYNFRGEYQRAIKFHEDAADAYAKLKSRNSQGQCYTNLAFAYSQMGNIDEADVAFNHALLASKEAGDRQTRWQAYEGLGCVKFNQEKYDKAEKHFLDALRLIPEKNEDASERVKQKLARVMEMKVALSRGQYRQGRGQMMYTQSSLGAMNESRLQAVERQIIPEQVQPVSAAPMPVGEQQFMSLARPIDTQQQQQQQQVELEIAAERKRYLKIRKKESIGHRHHPKMMIGLHSTMSNYSDSPRYVNTHRDSVLEEVEESSSSSESDSSEEGSSSSSSEEETENTTRMEDRTDKHDAARKTEDQLQELSPVVREIFRPTSASMQQSAAGQHQLPVHRADKGPDHRQYEQLLAEKEQNEEEDSSEDDSDSDSDEDSTSAEESESDKEKTTTETKAPTLPTQPPPQTPGFSSGDVATYMRPHSPQGKPYGTDDMTTYLDTSVTPSFYNTDYTPVPYDEVQDDSDTSEKNKNTKVGSKQTKPGILKGKGKSRNSNLPPSENTDPKTLYSTVDKANKTRGTVNQAPGMENGENGAPSIQIEKPKGEKHKREKSGNYFDSEGSVSGEDYEITRKQKLKESASNMSLHGSIRPLSGEDEEDPYHSINDVKRDTGDQSREDGNRVKGIDEMPRGQREAILSKEHVRRSELGPPLPERSKQEKESRTCVVM